MQVELEQQALRQLALTLLLLPLPPSPPWVDLIGDQLPYRLERVKPRRLPFNKIINNRSRLRCFTIRPHFVAGQPTRNGLLQLPSPYASNMIESPTQIAE